jgi:dihydroflavonol-4-reductase
VGVSVVTGGTGFIGSAVARALVERGDRVRITVRPRAPVDHLAGLDAEHVACDVTDAAAVARALRGADRLFHCAGLVGLRASRARHARVTVAATRTVLRTALEAGVPRVVHTSCFATVGPADRGRRADEREPFRAGPHGIPWVDATHEAESEALRLAAAGLPLTVVNPGWVLGRGDVHRSSTEVVRRFLRGELAAYVDGAINIVDVKDVARGILLAEERGGVGDRYLLGNRNFTLDRLLADLGRISGIEPPAVKLPLAVAVALARAGGSLPGGAGLHEPELLVMGQWWAFRSSKAQRELGWRPSHHEDTLHETIAWYREREPLRLRPPGSRQPVALRLAGFGLRRADAVASWIPGL